MTTILATSEEDSVLAVVRYTSELAWADAGPEVAEPQVVRLCSEAQECVVMGRWLDLASLMLTSADLIISRVSEKDLECFFTVICNLVTRSSSTDEELEMAKLISIKLSHQPNDKPALKLKLYTDCQFLFEMYLFFTACLLYIFLNSISLFNLYNLLGNMNSKFFIYTKALQLASSGKVYENIIPSFKKIDILLKEWNIGNVEQRSLFLAISNTLKGIKGMSKESFTFLVRYLATISGEDTHALNEAKEEAVHAIIEFVKSPDLFQCDLLDLPAIQQLEQDEEYALVYQLLDIFLAHRLDSYLDFQASNVNLLKSHGLVHEDCVTKMRLLSLIDISSNDSGIISYSLIKEALRITDEEIEYWIVKAITSKFLDCKMDEMNQVVIVSRHTDRVFGLSQWKALRSRLALWRSNIAGAIKTIQANKITEEGSSNERGVATR